MIYPSTINHLGAVLRFPLNYLGEVLTLAASTKVAVRRLDDFFARAPLGAFGGAFGGTFRRRVRWHPPYAQPP